MRRIVLISLLLLAGCRTFVGPFEHGPPPRVDDPLLTIPEQEQRGRDRLALPENSPTVAPRTYAEPPSQYGR